MSDKGNTPRRVFLILCLAALVPLLLYLFLFFHNNVVLATYPFSIEWGEGIVIDLARKIAEPSALYGPLDGYPYIVGIYPPGYLYLANVAGRFFDNPFLGGRIVALAAAAGCAVLIFLILVRETGRWEISLIGSLTFLSVSFVYDFAAMARVDSTACFFALLGLYLFSGRHPYWAAFFFVAALYTKQSMVAAPVACFAWLAFTERRRSRGPIVFFLALALLAFLALQLATGGRFILHIVRYMQHSYRLSQLLLLLRKSFAGTYILLAFAILYIAAGLRSRPRLDIFSSYWIAVCITLLFTGKAGSSLLYLMEYAGACSILFGLALGRIYEGVGRLRAPAAYGVTILAFALIGIQVYTSKDTCLYVKSFKGPREAGRTEAQKRLVDMVREEEGPVLAENVGLLINAGKEVPFHPFAISELSRLGLWDERQFVEDIRSKKFSLVVLESLRPLGPGSPGVRTTQFAHERFTEGMLDAIFSSYRPVSVLGGEWVFRARGEEQ